MTGKHWMVSLLALAIVLGGCGSGGRPLDPGPQPPVGGDDNAVVIEVGPMLIRPASTAGFEAETILSSGGCAFVAIHGARIDYMASQALLDRVVFASSRDGYQDIWVCDLDGSNMTQLTNNGAAELSPDWSPDGTKIAFERWWPAQDPEIMTMRADGSTIRTVTSNTAWDQQPSWSPDGRAITYQTNVTGNFEIFRIYEDGSSPTNLTNDPAWDDAPDWSPSASSPSIVFVSERDHAAGEVYTMGADGGPPTRLTNDTTTDDAPVWNAFGTGIAWERSVGTYDIFLMSSAGTHQRNFTNHPNQDFEPSWSGDGRWVAFVSQRAGNSDIWVQETNHPYRAYQVTTHTDTDVDPCLGSPTMQIERVLIGPPGSDWGGFDPIWASAYAGVVAFDSGGYRNFVRIGVRTADLGSLEITPLAQPSVCIGQARPVGFLVEANEIVNLREDAGRGLDPTVWDLDALNLTAAVLYLDTRTGKLISVLALDDATYPSATGSPGAAVTERAEGADLLVSGTFPAVFDASGHRVAGASSRVTIGADGAVNAI